MMRLDLSSLEKALASLKEALEEYEKTRNAFVRDSCIQRFEYTYELSHKMLKRGLMTYADAGEVEEMNLPQLIRAGASRGLLRSSWDIWKEHRNARNATSHAYNEKKAEEVFDDIPSFYEEAEYLLRRLQSLTPPDDDAPRKEIDIDAAHAEIVCAVLRARLPEKTRVWAFGSRVRGHARKYSDLDLALESVDGKRISDESISALKDAFDASDLPWKVDVLDMRAIGSEFKKIVEAQRMEFFAHDRKGDVSSL